jgi:hypothetical protein
VILLIPCVRVECSAVAILSKLIMLDITGYRAGVEQLSFLQDMLSYIRTNSENDLPGDEGSTHER